MSRSTTGQDGGDETRQRLVDVTVELLERDGNHALRLADVAQKAGVAVSTIYAHFHDRTDLVAAARLELFRQHTGRIREEVTAALDAPDSPDSPERLLEAAMWPSLLDPDNTWARERRWDRIEAMADSRHIESLARQLGERQADLNAEVIELVRLGKAHGTIDPDVDDAALALFSQAIRIGMVIYDLTTEHRPDVQAWQDLMIRFYSTLGHPQLPDSTDES